MRGGAVGKFGLLAIAIGSFAGCGNDKGTKPGEEPGNPLTFPLSMGRQWDYASTRTESGDTDPYDRTDEILGETIFQNQPYAVLRTIVTEEGGASPDTVFGYLRQTGQELFTYQEFDTSGVGGNEIFLYIFGKLNESLPWRMAAFTTRAGESWLVADISKTWNIQGGILTVSVKLTGANDGRTSLSVPAGSYSDVYVGRFVTEVKIAQNTPPLPPITQTEVATQTLYIKDGIGIVRETEHRQFSVTGSTPSVTTSASELRQYRTQ